jgi:hypothetical protein
VRGVGLGVAASVSWPQDGVVLFGAIGCVPLPVFRCPAGVVELVSCWRSCYSSLIMVATGFSSCTM